MENGLSQGKKESREKEAATASSRQMGTGCRLRQMVLERCGQVGVRMWKQEDELGEWGWRSTADKSSDVSKRVDGSAIYWDGKLGKELVLRGGWA